VHTNTAWSSLTHRQSVTSAPAFSTTESLAEIIIGEDRRPLLVLTDFDGTLCEFQPDPEAVFLGEGLRTTLSALAAQPRTRVGIVSGRRADDVRRRTRLGDDVYYAGLHGMEIDGPGTRFEVPGFGARAEELQQLGSLIAETVAPLRGALVEDKGLAVALHVRAATPPDRERAERAFWALATPALEAGTVRLQRGDCVFELLPDIDWNKGDAVRWIEADAARGQGAPLRPIYLGDDQTDEHAFNAIGDRGVSVMVGSRPSRARYQVPDPAAVAQLLARLVAHGGPR
jgi:trehalose-phosphatase